MEKERENRDIGPNLSSASAEAYGLLRTNLAVCLPQDQTCSCIGITSPLRGEGKTTTAINLAYTMAREGSRVLLLEADLRRPGLARRLEIRHVPGLSNFLAGQSGVSDCIHPSRLTESLWVMPAGALPENPGGLLRGAEMKTLLETLKTRFDVILLDLPPVTAASDALILSGQLSGMLLVVRQNYCGRSALEETVRKLEFSGAKLLGIVLTDSDTQAREDRRRSAQYYQHGAFPKAGKRGRP